MRHMRGGFWDRVEKGDRCWIWFGPKDQSGYGRYQNVPAHRYAYILEFGPILDGLVIDHLCRNPACVNPWHLEPVTARVNILRGEGVGAGNARKTHCINGHLFDEANTYIRKDRYQRMCRTCHRGVGTMDAPTKGPSLSSISTEEDLRDALLAGWVSVQEFVRILPRYTRSSV